MVYEAKKVMTIKTIMKTLTVMISTYLLRVSICFGVRRNNQARPGSKWWQREREGQHSMENQKWFDMILATITNTVFETWWRPQSGNQETRDRPVSKGSQAPCKYLVMKKQHFA